MPVKVGLSYWRASRAPRYSFLFALPLLVLYEAMAALLPESATHGVRNGADVLLRTAFRLLAGPRGPLVLGLIVVGACIAVAVRDARRHGGGVDQLRVGIFGGMLAESIVLALAFGAVVGVATARLLGAFGLLAMAPPIAALGLPTQLMVSLGAGLYEELVFRVLLVSALAAGARTLAGAGPRAAGVFAVVVGALVFSAFHYIGPYGDALELRSFVFRAIAGVAFSAIYLLRGFGIVAWTHALYDVFLFLVQ